MENRQHNAFLSDFLLSHRDDFEQCMEILRETNPRKYVETYTDMMKLLMPRKQDVSVNVGLDDDLRKLRDLAATRLDENGNHQRIENIDDGSYEELT